MTKIEMSWYEHLLLKRTVRFAYKEGDIDAGQFATLLECLDRWEATRPEPVNFTDTKSPTISSLADLV